MGENAGQFTTEYGNVSAASIGAIQRGILQIAGQGGDRFFGEPMLNIADFMQTVDVGGNARGVVKILAADRLMNSPRLYATFLLWMRSELFEQLPEAGDLDQPKLVFFSTRRTCCSTRRRRRLSSASNSSCAWCEARAWACTS